MYKLVKYPNELLNISSKEIDAETLKAIVDLEALKVDMILACKENNGIGLSAVQIGYPIRFMVMKIKAEFMAMCNPRILRVHGRPVKGVEGCLSFPDIYGVVSRSEEVEAEWFEIGGELKHGFFEGIEARCLQHEIDHMDGISFVKRMTDVERFKIQQKLTDLKSRVKP